MRLSLHLMYLCIQRCQGQQRWSWLLQGLGGVLHQNIFCRWHWLCWGDWEAKYSVLIVREVRAATLLYTGWLPTQHLPYPVGQNSADTRQKFPAPSDSLRGNGKVAGCGILIDWGVLTPGISEEQNTLPPIYTSLLPTLQSRLKMNFKFFSFSLWIP